MEPSVLSSGRNLPAVPFKFDRRDERIVQSVRRLAMTVAHMFSTPGAFLALYEDEDQLQIMACYGVDLAAHPESGFLSSALVTPGRCLIVPDAEDNPAFANDVWVKNAGIRFFAGAPMIDASGHPVGMLCLVDHQDRSFSNAHVKLLANMAAIGVSELSTHYRLRVKEHAFLHAQAQLQRSESHHERMMTGLPIPVFTVDAAGALLSWNRSCSEVLGYEPRDVLGTSFAALLDEPEAADGFARLVERVFNRRRISGLEIAVRTAGGDVRRLNCRLLPVYDERGSIDACAFMAVDHTERHRLEAQNHDLAIGTRLHAAVAGVCSFTLVQEADGTCWMQRASDSFGAITGIPFDTSRPLRWTDMLHPEDVAGVVGTYAGLAPHASATVTLRLRIPHVGHRAMVHAVQLVAHDAATNTRRYLGVLRAQEAAAPSDWEQPHIARLKASILSTMSHEIRTPLTSILGFAELLGAQENGTHRHFARLIEDSAHRLMRTLSAVLDLAQLEENLLDLDAHGMDFGRHVMDVSAPYREAAIEKGLLWHFHMPSTDARVQLDERASRRVIKHLLDNAIKFTRRGAIQIMIALRDDEAVLTVEDTGVGIASAFLPHLFSDFRQEATGITRPFEGAGLGLAITRRLVESMGGTIGIESTKGHGTTVTVRYPVNADGA